VEQSHKLFAWVLHLKNAEINVLIAEQQEYRKTSYGWYYGKKSL